MATTRLGLKNDHGDQSQVSKGWLNAVADELDAIGAVYSDLFGAGVVGASGLNLTIVSGAIALEISAGWAIVGDATERWLVHIPSTVTIDTDQSLAASSTRYVYLLKEPVDPLDLATYFTANTSGTPPADSIEIGKAVFNGTEATSVDSRTPGRTNLLTPLHSQSLIVDPGAAGADLSNLAIWAAPTPGAILAKIGIVPQESPAGIDNANTCVVLVKDAAGNTVVTKTYNTGTPAPAIRVYGDLGALDATHKLLTANEVLTISITQGATADIGSLVIVLEWRLT